MIKLIQGDCMEYMKGLEDNAFDLAIVDPPYGIGFDGEVGAMVNSKTKKWSNPRGQGYERKEWDKEPPSYDYFIELSRVSRNRIIWGGNYFALPQSRGWIVWNKGVARGMSLSPCELAWSSFDKSANMVDLLWAGFRRCECAKRIHPTQKPVKLYEWLLANYAKEGDRILDTHLGSGSSAIAAHYYGVDFVGIELDEDYFKAAKERIDNETRQESLF